jgi:drug/metabolite transporter (DMT)-like permease
VKKLYCALIGLSLIWGTSFLFIKILLEEMGPATVVFGRCLFGTLLLGILLICRKQKLNFRAVPWGMVLLIALLNNVIPWSFISFSETKISSNMASIINATTPIWTLMIGFFFFSSTLRKNQWIGIMIGFCGIFILSDINSKDMFTGNTLGIVFMTGATFCYGYASQLTKKYLNSLTIMETSFYTLVISTIISLLSVLIIDPVSLTVLFEIPNIIRFIGLGSLGSGIAYLLYYYLVKQGSPEFASLVTYLVPVSALLWGFMLLKEPIHLFMLVGLVIILGGVYVSSLKPKKIMGLQLSNDHKP